jgi:hypothetical protein
MSIHEQDTDPSSPSALRGLVATDPTPNPATHVSTDPGLGPGGQSPTPGSAQPPLVTGGPLGPAPSPSPLPPQATQRLVPAPPAPLGIIVPAASNVKAKKDSVELLLDGMQGLQLERPKTTPQTDGESHAAYHAQHPVHPSRVGPGDEPKVVVERPVLSATTRIDRSKVEALVAQHNAQQRTSDATVVLPQQVAPRVVVALVAGLVVVIGIFFVVKVIVARGGDPSAKGASAGTQTVVPAATAAAIPTTPAAASPVPAVTATAGAASTAAAPQATTGGPASPAATSPAATAAPATTATAARTNAAPARSFPGASAGNRPRTTKPSATDVGEFKTTF